MASEIFVSTEELSFLTGLPVREIRKLQRQGVITPEPEPEKSGAEDSGSQFLRALEEFYYLPVTIKELADMMDVSVRRIQQLQQEGVIEPIPEKKEGAKYREGSKYYAGECLRGLIDYYRCKGR